MVRVAHYAFERARANVMVMMMLLFKPIKSEKVIHVTFNVFSIFPVPLWKCHLQWVMILMSNQWLEILWPNDYSSITLH